MKKIAVLLTFLTITNISFGQVDTTIVPFIAYWSPGDSYNFKVTKVSQKWKEGEVIRNDSTSYVANFKVIDSTATSYTINWSFQQDLSALGLPKELVEVMESYKRTEVIYKTTENGEYIGIENWEEIGRETKSQFEKAIEAVLAKNNVDSKTFEKAMAPIVKMHDSKEGIEQLVFSELQFMHFPYGVGYPVNEPIHYEDEYPNMLGGKPLKADASIFVSDVDFDKAYCKIVQKSSISEEDMKQLTLTMLKKMGFGSNEIKKMIKNSNIEIIDKNIYEFIYNPGIPVRIEIMRKNNVLIDGKNILTLDKKTIEWLQE